MCTYLSHKHFYSAAGVAKNPQKKSPAEAGSFPEESIGM